MKNLDRLVALAILAFSIAYAWLSWNYALLPFERHQIFRPNTMPMGLAVISIVLCLAVLFSPHRPDSNVMDESTVESSQEAAAAQKHYDKIRPVILIFLMIAYALLLRPAGFIIATSGFLVASSMVLGERKYHFLLPVAISGTLIIWYVVQELLGIYLNPWPRF